uniref:Uncharacterized protein n=1 Tax=Nelumbo nucifera TaxID=4432 RepID=A0A822YXK6_NELNU|nr:TPA_asm: hypothetical protein HUJ06_008052 [Nelumbo nucifera]
MIDKPKESSGVEKKETSNTKVAVKFTNGFGEDRAAKGSFLNQTLGFSEAASIAC